VSGDRYYVTMIVAGDRIRWDLRSGDPDGGSVRVAEGDAHTWAAATHQAGSALMKWVREKAVR
jgi:hypothetical protein